jgi:hypothetical protein
MKNVYDTWFAVNCPQAVRSFACCAHPGAMATEGATAAASSSSSAAIEAPKVFGRIQTHLSIS